MSLTLPQIVMLGHASSVNFRRSGLADAGKKPAESYGGKDTSEMNTEEYKRYFFS